MGLAHSYIDAVSEAGADAVKFQYHIASDESTVDDVFRVNFSKQDINRYDYWKRMEFTINQWEELAEHASNKGLIFFASAFSVSAIKRLVGLGVPMLKIASGEVAHNDLLETIKSTRLPVYLSTGMSNWEEIDNLVEELCGNGTDVTLMQCTSRYPTPLSQVGLNVLDEFKERYDIKIGLSDHTGTIYPSLAVIGHGIDAVEVHVVFNKSMFGPDTTSSITIDEFRFLAQYRDKLDEMLRSPVSKDKLADQLSDIRRIFGRSLTLNRALPMGSILTEGDIISRKPGTGIDARYLSQVVGKQLSRDIDSERILKWEDLLD